MTSLRSPYPSSGSRQFEEQKRVAQPARVVQQVPDRQRAAVVGHLGQIFPHRIVQRELAALGKQHDAHRGELLRDRRGFEDGSWRNRHRRARGSPCRIRARTPELPSRLTLTEQPGEPGLSHWANSSSMRASGACALCWAGRFTHAVAAAASSAASRSFLSTVIFRRRIPSAAARSRPWRGPWPSSGERICRLTSPAG